MDISNACNTVRLWEEFFSKSSTIEVPTGDLGAAVKEIKRYLEYEKADGKPIRELEIADHLLLTREGVRWVMAFVLSAESMEASRRRKTLN